MRTWLARLTKAPLNQRLVYLYTLLFNASSSILFQHVLSGYIFVLTESNAIVGWVKGIQGVSQLVSTFPLGYLADIYRRDQVLVFGGFLGVFAAMLTLLPHFMMCVFFYSK